MRNEHLSEEEIRKREEKQKKMKEKMNNHHSHMKKSKSKQKIEISNRSNSNSATNSDLDILTNENNVNISNNNSNSLTSIRSSSNGQELDDVDLEDMEGDFDDFFIEHRPSLAPPPKTTATWGEYISAEEGCWPNLGRKIRCKESKKEFKAQLAMVSILCFFTRKPKSIN